MSEPKLSRLRFNFGFLLEAIPGTSRDIELDYPQIKVSSDLTLIPLQGAFNAARTATGVFIKGLLRSYIAADCNRCLNPFSLPINIVLDDHFYYPPHLAPDGEYTFDERGIIDLSPLVREMALLDIPINPTCRAACQGLCQSCGQNLNEADCGCEAEDIDPRMAILQQLLEDSNQS